MSKTADIVPLSTTDRQTPVRRKSRQRSRIANGSSVLAGVDGRLLWPRRFKELFADHLSDTPDASVAERSILRRACTLEVELERMETMFALAGEASPEAIDLYARCAANLRRLLESVGLARRQRNVSPSLDQYLARHVEAAP
jgi:hypothetical protein